ncbi:helix-turn-helix transcriptional regulator [Streptomyces sp. NPDC006610]|uniref:helix-turn-helix domain-containing protein n=1 Tax=Streptomyces sp. NPDC006610 TaxID=3154584 RepID=UPI0033BE47BD
MQRRVALGHRIAELRHRADLSQEQLAHLAGMERRSIQRYEGARRDPQFSDLLLIAHALRVHVTDLLGSGPQPPSGPGVSESTTS